MSAGRYGRWRRASQLAVTALHLALPWLGGSAVAGTLVALRAGPVDLVEPASALSAVLAGGRVAAALVVGVAPLVLLALALGPVYCSWGCPYGLFSELLDRLRPRARRRWHGRPERRARRVRVIALALLLAGSLAAGLPLAAIVAPPRLVTALPLELAAGGVPALTLLLLAGVLAVELLAPRRMVCRALCPAGAAAALLRRPRTLAPRYDPTRCRCPEVAPCLQACPWGVDPRGMAARDGCTTCLACVDRCPTIALTLGAVATARPPP